MLPSCRAIIIWKDKILLHHRDDKPTIFNPDAWTPPGGGIEKNEGLQEAMVRELYEEASYSPKNLKYIGLRLTEVGTITHFFFSFVEDNEAKLFKKGVEGQGVGFFNLEEMLKLKLSPILGKFLKEHKKVIEETIKSKKLPSAQSLDLKTSVKF